MNALLMLVLRPCRLSSSTQGRQWLSPRNGIASFNTAIVTPISLNQSQHNLKNEISKLFHQTELVARQRNAFEQSTLPSLTLHSACHEGRICTFSFEVTQEMCHYGGGMMHAGENKVSKRGVRACMNERRKMKANVSYLGSYSSNSKSE